MSHRLDEFERAYRQAAEEGLRWIAETLLGMAQREAPIKEGTLRGSGSIRADHSIGELAFIVFFPLIYAAVQHERTDYNHPGGGKAKYLEDPLKAIGSRLETVLGEYIALKLAARGFAI